MRMKPPHPTTIMDDRTTNAVHHPSERECGFLSRFAFVTPPARYFAQEFSAHVSPAVIGRPKLIGKVISLGTERSWLQRNYFKTRLGKQWQRPNLWCPPRRSGRPRQVRARLSL